MFFFLQNFGGRIDVNRLHLKHHERSLSRNWLKLAACERFYVFKYSSKRFSDKSSLRASILSAD